MPDIETPFHGIWPAMLTPLTGALDIDVDAFARHAKELLAAGCVGITPFGTTGEGPSFSVAERRAAIDGLVARGIPAERIIVSTSCAALPDTVELTRHAVSIGAHGCLILPPFFLKGVSDRGVIDAYRWVIDRVIDGAADPRLRVYLYNIPQVSGVPLSREVILDLKLRYPQIIVGLKDSGCQREVSIGFADAFMNQVRVYVGNEADLQTLGARGSTGAISGLANIAPRLVWRLVSQYASPGAPSDQQRMLSLLAILNSHGLTAAYKGAMAVRHGNRGWLRVRPPLVALTDAELARLETQLREFGLDPLGD
jgi:4-hydroxy-tetrahydrodipicolinate synthase